MPVVILYGDEDYLLQRAADGLRKSILTPDFAALCHKVYSQPSLATALEAVGTVSFALLGGGTLIEIRDFLFLREASKDPQTDRQLEELRSLLESLEPTKTVLFLSNKLDVRIKFPKWIVNHPQFTVRKFESVKFWETDKAVAFLMQHAAEKGLSIAEKAAELLVTNIGTELRFLVNELDKLELYTHGRKITVKDVELICNHSDNLFQLINRWILKENPEENFRDLSEILLKRPAMEIFKTMQSYFNNIFRAVWLSSQGVSINMIAQRTGQKPFTIKNNIPKFSKVPMSRWITLKQLLVDMEWRAKTGRLDGQLALEILLGA